MSNKYRKQRRAKRHIPFEPKVPMMVKAALVFGPLDAIIDRLEADGTALTDERGNPVAIDLNGEEYDAAGGIEGLIWHLEIHASRHGLTLPLDPLRELQIAFKYIKPIMPSTVAKLREALPVLRRAMADANQEEQIDILRTVQIRAELEHAA